MVELEELLVNLKEYISPYCYTKDEDEQLFKTYLKNVYYNNGNVGIEKEYLQSTTYNKGELITSWKGGINFFDGEMSVSDGTNATFNNGVLVIP